MRRSGIRLESRMECLCPRRELETAMTRRNGRYGRKYNRLGSRHFNPSPMGFDIDVSNVSAFGDVLVVLGSDLLMIPEPANGFYLVRIKMKSGVITSGYMESLSRTNLKIRMKLRPDIFDWRENGPNSPIVKVKNMRRLMTISPLGSIDVKINHPGLTFKPAPSGNILSGKKISSKRGLKSRRRRRR